MDLQTVIPAFHADPLCESAKQLDVDTIRQNIYLGPGYHVIRRHLDVEQVANIVNFWRRDHNRSVRRYVKSRRFYAGCPNISHHSENRDRHLNYFWNPPRHAFTYQSAWQLQTLRNQIEGNPIDQDFLPHSPKNRRDPDYCSASSFRVITTRVGGAVAPHVDCPLDHSRIQFELMLSSYGEDYTGGLCLEDKFRSGRLLNICETERLQAGDLLIFRYCQRHGVSEIKNGSTGKGFSRMLMPLESVPVRRSPVGRLSAASRKSARRLRKCFRKGDQSTVRPSYDETPYADGQSLYYDEDVIPLMNIAIEEGFPPSEIFYHKGLWARFKMFTEWQFDALKRHGLQPQHNFLDIGCGFMRLGMKLVPFLDDDRYHGTDSIQGFVELADRYMDEFVSCGKRYNLLCDSTFNFKNFSRHFDFAMAHSVFTHMSFEQIEKCLYRLKEVMNPGGKFLFSICLGSDRQDDFVYVNDTPMTHSQHRDVSFYEALAKTIGFDFRFLERADHPSEFVCLATF